MEQPTDIFPEELQNLFLEGEIPPFLNDIQFNLNQEIHDETLDDIATFFQPGNDDPADTNVPFGDLGIELNHILPEVQWDAMAINDMEQLTQDQLVDQIELTEIAAVPQQAIGNENGLTYQMFPFIFGDLFGNMTVTQQPTANKRVRYACDGRRFLPDSRYHPMTIQLPDMRSLLFPNNAILGVVMTIVTNADNPWQQTLVHENDVSCEEAGAEKLAHGSVFVPLDQFETEKSFRRVSILYKKYEEYTFNLIPFNTATMFGPAGKYTTPDRPNMEQVPKGKRFRQEYNLSTYKFVFHLAVKVANTVHISNITCETNDIDEQIAPARPRKRSSTVSQESVSDDEENTLDSQSSNAPKRFRASTPPLDELPVIRVSNASIPPNIGD